MEELKERLDKLYSLVEENKDPSVLEAVNDDINLLIEMLDTKKPDLLIVEKISDNFYQHYTSCKENDLGDLTLKLFKEFPEVKDKLYVVFTNGERKKLPINV